MVKMNGKHFFRTKIADEEKLQDLQRHVLQDGAVPAQRLHSSASGELGRSRPVEVTTVLAVKKRELYTYSIIGSPCLRSQIQRQVRLEADQCWRCCSWGHRTGQSGEERSEAGNRKADFLVT